LQILRIELTMERIGPELPRLTRRLAQTPSDFLDEPKIGKSGRLVVAALVNDLLRRFGRCAHDAELATFAGNNVKQDRNRLQLIAIATWLLADDWFIEAKISADAVLSVLGQNLTEIAGVTRADKFINDPERREEFVRVILARLQFRPEGESKAQAIDRLSALSSIERRRLLAESREAEKRARQIREALARKAAEESADKWTRE
jgi:hypothetical protein